MCEELRDKNLCLKAPDGKESLDLMIYFEDD